MTRKKAFELAMQACKETWNEKTCAEIIKALEQEPCEDATLKDIFCMGCEYKEQEPMTDVLDNLRAEIEWLKLHKAEFLTSDNKVCIDSQKVLEIIDKYKAESEGV